MKTLDQRKANNNVIKHITTAILCLIVLISVMTGNVQAKSEENAVIKPTQYKVEVNDKQSRVELDTININSRTYAELNTLIEAINWNITQVEEDNKVILRNEAGTRRIDLYLNDSVIRYNHTVTILRSKLHNIDGKVYAPVKELVERCGWQVDWVPEQNKVEISNKINLMYEKGKEYNVYTNIDGISGFLLYQEADTGEIKAQHSMFEVVGKEYDINPEYIEFEVEGKSYLTGKNNFEIDQTRTTLSEHYRSERLTEEMETVLHSGEFTELFNYTIDRDKLGPNAFKSVGGKTNSEVSERMKTKVLKEGKFEDKVKSIILALLDEEIEYEKDSGHYSNIDKGTVNCKSVTALLRESVEEAGIEYRVIMTLYEGDKISHCYLELLDDNGFWRELDGTRYIKHLGESNVIKEKSIDTIKTDKKFKLDYVQESTIVKKNEKPDTIQIAIKTPSIKNGKVEDNKLVILKYLKYDDLKR